MRPDEIQQSRTYACTDGLHRKVDHVDGPRARVRATRPETGRLVYSGWVRLVDLAALVTDEAPT